MAVVYDTQCCRKLSVIFVMYLGFTSTLMIKMFCSMIRLHMEDKYSNMFC